MKYRPKVVRPPPVQDWERRIAKLEGKLKSSANYGFSGPSNWHSPYPPQVKLTQEKASCRIWGGNFVERCLSLGQDLNRSSSKRCEHPHGSSAWRAPSMPSVSLSSNTYASTPYRSNSHIYESIPSRSVVEDKFYQAQKWTSMSYLTYGSKSVRNTTSDSYSKYSRTSTRRFTDNFSSYSIQSKFTDNFGSMSLNNKSAPSKSRQDQFGGITRWPSDLSGDTTPDSGS